MKTVMMMKKYQKDLRLTKNCFRVITRYWQSRLVCFLFFFGQFSALQLRIWAKMSHKADREGVGQKLTCNSAKTSHKNAVYRNRCSQGHCMRTSIWVILAATTTTPGQCQIKLKYFRHKSNLLQRTGEKCNRKTNRLFRNLY